MQVTLSGIVTLVRLGHPPNALTPMLVTPLGIVTLVRFVQDSERLVPDVGDALGDRVRGRGDAWGTLDERGLRLVE